MSIGTVGTGIHSRTVIGAKNARVPAVAERAGRLGLATGIAEPRDRHVSEVVSGVDVRRPRGRAISLSVNHEDLTRRSWLPYHSGGQEIA